MKPYIQNPNGYTLTPHHIEKTWFGFRQKRIYEFTLDPVAPVTLLGGTGVRIRPDRHFFTDQGSVPWLLQWRIPKDLCPVAFAFHDSCYRHKGWYQSWPQSNVFEFKPCTRAQADDLLYDMARLEGVCDSDAGLIWMGVRAGGWPAWGREERR